MPLSSEEISRLRQQLEKASKELQAALKREADLRSTLNNAQDQSSKNLESQAEATAAKLDETCGDSRSVSYQNSFSRQVYRTPSETLPQFLELELNPTFAAAWKSSGFNRQRSRQNWSLEIPREANTGKSLVPSPFIRQGSESFSRQDSVTSETSEGSVSHQSSFHRQVSRTPSETLPKFLEPELNPTLSAAPKGSHPSESSKKNDVPTGTKPSGVQNLASALIRQWSSSISRQDSDGSSRQDSLSRQSSLSRRCSSEIELPPPDFSKRFPVRVVRRCLDAHEGEIFGIACSTDGDLIATGGGDGRIRVQTMETDLHTEYITDSAHSITTLTFLTNSTESSHTSLLCAGTSNGEVHMYKRNTKKSQWDLSRVLSINGSLVHRLLDGQDSGSAKLLSGSSDRKLALADVESGEDVWSITTPSRIFDVAMLKYGSGEIVCGHYDGEIRVYCPRQRTSKTGGLIHESGRVHSAAIVGLAVLHNGFGVVSLGRDNAMKLNDLRMNGKVVQVFEDAGLDTISDWHRICADENVIYCGLGHSGRVGVWNANTGAFDRALSTRYRPKVRDYDDISSRTAVVSEVLVPYWTSTGRFVCVHEQKQLSFWESKTKRSSGSYE